MNNHILLTGATGNTGKIIAEELKRNNIPFVAMAHTEKRRSELERMGISAVVGDFDDSESLEDALIGVQRAYLVCTPDENLVARETAFIEAAKKVDVSHIVKCSAYLAGINAETQNLRSHGIIEQTLIDSGLTYTIIRPHGFMQTFTGFAWDMIQRAGVISLPAGDGKIPLVDTRDVAKVAVKALTESGHAGKIYDVTGSEALSFYEQAAILQRVLGCSVTYMPGDEQQLKFVMSVLGVPETPTEHTLKIFQMLREHRIEKIHSTLQELGIQPITYEQFLNDLTAGRTGGGNSFQPPDTFKVRIMNAMMPLIMQTQLYIHKRRLRTVRRKV